MINPFVLCSSVEKPLLPRLRHSSYRYDGFYYFVGWALPTEIQPIFTEKAGNARPTNLRSGQDDKNKKQCQASDNSFQ